MFGKFIEKWRDNVWREPLRQAIYWYVVSNGGGGGIEGSVVLNQTGLELLAWVKLVEDPATRRLSAEGFNELKANDKMALLLLDMKIPREIPPFFSGLLDSKMAKVANDDAFDLLRLIRNCIVHPSKKNRLQLPDVHVVEAWSLGLWYLEMSILNILGYNGSYRSRVRSGGPVERVPWVDT